MLQNATVKVMYLQHELYIYVYLPIQADKKIHKKDRIYKTATMLKQKYTWQSQSSAKL